MEGWDSLTNMQLINKIEKKFNVADLRRVGHYEKATLPGSRSYGSSAVCGFTPYNVYVSARYGFTARHRLRAEVFAGEYMPCYEDIFLSPDYSNALAGGIRSERVAGVQAEYRVPLAWFAVAELAGYLVHTHGAMQVDRYYDDLYSAYCDMVMSGITRLDWGVEAGVRIELAERLVLLTVLSVGNNIYRGEPEVAVYEDASGRLLSAGRPGTVGRFRTFGHSADDGGRCTELQYGLAVGLHARRDVCRKTLRDGESAAAYRPLSLSGLFAGGAAGVFPAGAAARCVGTERRSDEGVHPLRSAGVRQPVGRQSARPARHRLRRL